MTDYLEELLELLEQEELEQMPEWERSVRSKWAQAHLKHEPEAWERPRNNGLPQIQQRGTEPLEQEIRVKRRGAAKVGRLAEPERSRDTTPTQQNHSTVQPLAAEIIRLHRAVRQAQKQAGRRTSQDVGVVADAKSGAVWSAGTTASKSIDYAAIVDMAFARDARRYDGPLGLV